MSTIPGMTLLSLTELRNRVPVLSIEIIAYPWVAQFWNENWFRVRNHFTLELLEAHRIFLGVPKLTREHITGLIGKDTTTPDGSRCHVCKHTIAPAVRWSGLNADGTLETNADGSLREYGATAIIPDETKRLFVAKFCLDCQAGFVLSSKKARWATYAQSIRDIAEIVRRRDEKKTQQAAESRAAKEAKFQAGAEQTVRAIASMLSTPASNEEEVEVLTEADLITETPAPAPAEEHVKPPVEKSATAPKAAKKAKASKKAAARPGKRAAKKEASHAAAMTN